MRGEVVNDTDVPLEIHIAADDNKKTLTIQVITTANRVCVIWELHPNTSYCMK